MNNVEWFAPGLVISVVVGLAASRPVGRWLGARPTLVWVLLACLGAIVAATLTPVRDPLEFEFGAAGVGVCDFSRFGPAPLDELRTFNETSLNILLFVPFGATVGLLPNGRPKALVVLAAIALPFAIEAIQLVATTLHRGCQSADVADNLTGLIVGFAIGHGLSLVVSLTGPGRQPPAERRERVVGRD
jgi:hypothetical protein